MKLWRPVSKLGYEAPLSEESGSSRVITAIRGNFTQRSGISMERNFCDSFSQAPDGAAQQRPTCPENSLDGAGERREPPAHMMASHRFPLDHIPHSNC